MTTEMPRVTAGKSSGLDVGGGVAGRRTDELVIGVVGAVGSGVSTAARVIGDVLERDYGYSRHYIRVSELIQERAPRLNPAQPVTGERNHERIARLQRVGNALRERFSPRYLAGKCVERIAVDRINPPGGADGGYAKLDDGEHGGPGLVPVGRRRVHIIDALKHPAEVDLLRAVYGDTFWLFGVFAPEDVRTTRLLRLGHDRRLLATTIKDDEEDGLEHGQKVRDTAHLADFFVRNDAPNEDRLKRTIERYLSIMFNIGVNTPTQDETAMYNAASQASTSACLSRQVGAAIFSSHKELIGVGTNDVPKSRGGLYCSADGDHDHRCYKFGGGMCHNDERKSLLYKSIFARLDAAKLLVPGVDLATVTAALKRTEVRDLIEYSRANHAEMEAILSVARGNKPGLVGATLYSTTFPCHSCARLIVGSGIARVVYIEPYPKSLALELHGDAISVHEADGPDKVVFLQYEGVAPKNMIRLFAHGQKRKVEGRLVQADARTAAPVFPSPLDGFTTREQLIVKELKTLEALPVHDVRGEKGRTDGESHGATEAEQLPLAVTGTAAIRHHTA